VRSVGSIMLAALAILACAAPAAAQLPPGHPELDGPFMRLNLQRPELVVEIPVRWEGAAPDAWSVTVWQPGTLPGPDRPGATERLIARGAGTGAPTGDVLAAVVDPEWRWRLLATPDREVQVRWTWTSGGSADRDEWLRLLSMFTNAGRSDGGMRFAPRPNTVPIFTGSGDLGAPPNPYWVNLGKLVSKRLGKATFLAGGRLRPTVKLPWVVPWEGASVLKGRVVDVRGRNPNFGVVVYSGSSRPRDKEGAGATITARLTPKGRRLARRVGAASLAARLATGGLVDFDHRPIRGEAPISTWVPIDTCFRDDLRPKRHPCAQTCPRFPGMPTGYLMFTALGGVYGSTTCAKGAPLPPDPMG
jgi:hypothetical protein